MGSNLCSNTFFGSPFLKKKKLCNNASASSLLKSMEMHDTVGHAVCAAGCNSRSLLPGSIANDESFQQGDQAE
ncbi:hypothetical protein L208DRAFT_871031 [Tricholoma matsutake]|nr:hypothetical protein L208DRAFT_871031 [Tricholoma matsutake 945]